MDRNFISRFFKGVLSTGISTIATVTFHFLSISIMARYISKEELGIYFLILAIVHFANILSGLGFNLTIVKLISGESGDEGISAVPGVLLMRLTSLAVFCAISWAWGHLIFHYFDQRINDFTLFIPILFFFTSFRDLFYNIMQGLQLFKKYATIQVLSALIKFSLILIIVVVSSLNLKMLIYIEIATVLLGLLIQSLVIPFYRLISSGVSPGAYKKVLHFSIPLYFNNILAVIHSQTNTFIIGVMLTPVSVALYSIAHKIPEGFMRMFTSFIIVYFPSISELFTEDKKADAENLLNKSLIFLSIGIVFCVLVSFLFGNQIIRLVFSEKYSEISFFFSLLMLNFYFRAVSNIMGYSLVSAGYSTIPPKVSLISGILNIVSSLIMIPIFGIAGAVYSLLTMNIVSVIIYYLYLVGKKFQIVIFEFLKPLLLCLSLVFVFKLLNINSIILKSVVLFIYLIFCLMIVGKYRDLFFTTLKKIIYQ